MPRRDGLTLAIAIAGIAATLIGTLTGAAISGHQQSVLQDKNLRAQAVDSDKKELRGVVDDAEAALEAAARAANTVRPSGSSFRSAQDRIGAMTPLRASLTIRLGPDHPMTRYYTAAQAGLRAKANFRSCSPSFLGTPPTVHKLINESVTAFQVEGRRLLGSSVGGPVGSPAGPTTLANLVRQQRRVEADFGRGC
jgi:hypothetical protein